MLYLDMGFGLDPSVPYPDAPPPVYRQDDEDGKSSFEQRLLAPPTYEQSEQAPTYAPPEAAPTLDQRLLEPPPATAAPSGGVATPELDAYRQAQQRTHDWQAQHGIFDPQTGEWTPKPISHGRAIGLAALRGLMGGPMGALTGAVIGAVSPGRVAQVQYNEGLAKMRGLENDALRQGQEQANIRQIESEIAHRDNPPELQTPEGVYEQDGTQPRMAVRDRGGNLIWQKTPEGGPVYGAPKPEPKELQPRNMEKQVGFDASGRSVLFERPSGSQDPNDWKPAGLPPGYSPTAPPEAKSDLSEVQRNAEISGFQNSYKEYTANAQRADTDAQATEDAIKMARSYDKKSGSFKNWPKSNDAGYKERVQQIAQGLIGEDGLPDPDAMKDAMKDAAGYRKEARDHRDKATDAQAEILKRSYSAPPRRVGPSMPAGAANPVQADRLLQRAAKEGRTLLDANGQPVPNPYVRQ